MSEEDKAKMDGLKVYEHPGLTWVNVTAPSKELMAELKFRYPFLVDMDLRDCLPPYQRPKLMERREYIFMVLLFPVFREETGRIRIVELDVFISKDLIITSHTGGLKQLADMASCYDQATPTCPPENLKGPADWLHAILNELYSGCFPMLTHVANDISDLERDLFSDLDKSETVRDILRVKQNIVDFRKAIQGHKRVIEKFINAAPGLLKLDGLKVYYEDLVGQTKEIWDFLENDSATIGAIYESYTTLVNHETSQATKALSALGLIIFPTTLVATVFAMDSEHMPIRGYAGDWWIQMALVLTTAALVIHFLKKKRWL